MGLEWPIRKVPLLCRPYKIAYHPGRYVVGLYYLFFSYIQQQHHHHQQQQQQSELWLVAVAVTVDLNSNKIAPNQGDVHRRRMEEDPEYGDPDVLFLFLFCFCFGLFQLFSLLTFTFQHQIPPKPDTPPPPPDPRQPLFTEETYQLRLYGGNNCQVCEQFHVVCCVCVCVLCAVYLSHPQSKPFAVACYS